MQKRIWTSIVVSLVFTNGIISARADISPAQRAEMQAHYDKAREIMSGAAPDSADAIIEYTAAIEMATKASDGGPNFKSAIVDAYRNRALAYSDDKAWEEAIADFDEALKVNSNDVESLIGRAEVDSHFGLGMFDEVQKEPEVNPLDDINAALKINPNSGHAYVARGNFFQRGIVTQDDLKKALPEYEKATQVDPKYAEGWFQHGKALILIRDSPSKSQANTDIDRAIALQPKAEYFYTRTTILSNQTPRDYPAIITDYTSAIKYDPYNAARYTGRAQAQSSSPNPDKAQMLADYTQAIKLLTAQQDEDFAESVDVDLGIAQQKRGDLEFASGQYGEALTDFNDAIKNNPFSSDALAGREQIVLAAGKPEMVIQEVSARMAQIRVDGRELYAGKLFAVRGQAFLEPQRYNEALLDFNQAIKADSLAGVQIYSKNADLYFWRAVTWGSLGDKVHALADVNVAAKLNPAYIEKVKGTEFEKVLIPRDADKSVIIDNGDTAVLHKLMGDEWTAAGLFSNAVLEYDKAVALDPNYAEAYNNRGVAWMQIKNFGIAETDINKAIALKADDPRFYSSRSTLRMLQQRGADFIADAKKATELAPQNITYWEDLATAQQLNNAYADAETSLNAALKLTGDDKAEAGALQTKILLVRAIQNHAPTADELNALFAIADKDVLSFVIQSSDAGAKLHPEAATTLKNLRDAAAAQMEKLKAN